MDVISRLEEKDEKLKGEIDLKNLFSKGAELPWPKLKQNGFLSYKHCKSLWTLGARTTMNAEQSMGLIEDIITCANVYNYSKKNNIQKIQEDFGKYENKSIYIQAYAELATYLRYLMIHYDNKITDESLKEISVPLINYLKSSLNSYDEICIINYSYDVWLERLLKLNNLEFNVEGFEENNDRKIKIIKPHGSISFSFKSKAGQGRPFVVRTLDLDEVSQECSEFDVNYDFKDDYPIVTPIIPPAGDSNRTDVGWVKNLREIINDKVTNSGSKDKLIIFGLSYWHVDRAEIDDIITRIDPLVQVVLINPNPPTSLDAVLTSVFQNYIHYTKSEHLENSYLKEVALQN
ncbi:hypothetical protein CN391_15810 [Bacillus anthracis]|nr:hypothetical protein CN391_15810 [Bacillus anthracis]